MWYCKDSAKPYYTHTHLHGRAQLLQAMPFHITLGYYRLVYELQNLASFPVLCPDFISQLGGGLEVRLAESRCMS